MARRRMSAYGSTPPPKSSGGGFPLPPPPDGKPPVRLSFEGANVMQPQPQATQPESAEASLMRLLQSMGKA